MAGDAGVAIWLAAACLLVGFGFGLGFGAGVQAGSTGGGRAVRAVRAAGSDGMSSVPDAVAPPVTDVTGTVTRVGASMRRHDIA